MYSLGEIEFHIEGRVRTHPFTPRPRFQFVHLSIPGQQTFGYLELLD